MPWWIFQKSGQNAPDKNLPVGLRLGLDINHISLSAMQNGDAQKLSKKLGENLTGANIRPDFPSLLSVPDKGFHLKLMGKIGRAHV